METVNLLIKGKVQGVFYRASAREVAKELGIKGWVKNTDAGEVEIVASGDQKSLERFIQWCHKGPSRAVVTNVTVVKIDLQSHSDFRIIK